MYPIIHQQVFHFIYRFKAPHKSIAKEEKGDYSGFTLIELMVVIATLGVLAGFIIPLYLSYLDKAKNTTAMADISALEKHIEVYHASYGELPKSLKDIGKKKFRDPWGKRYKYRKLKRKKKEREG